MDVNAKKRARSANFTSDEKILILNIIAKYKNIIENKKTDALCLEQKSSTWKIIADEFNAVSSSGIFRNGEALKKFFDNKKKEVRKVAAEEKKEILLTGGGIATKIIKDPSHEIALSIINQKTVYGLQNPVDSDNKLPSCSGTTGIVLDLNPESPRDQSIMNYLKITSSDEEDENMNLVTEGSEDNFERLTVNQGTNWGKYTPAKLQTPVTSTLKRNRVEDEQQSAPRARNVNLSRRRPAAAVRALTSSHLAEKYNKLLEKRIKIANLQAKKLEADLSNDKEEHTLKCRVLNVQIQCKEEKLKMLQKM